MSHLNITEAVPLGYALVARVAYDAGVRALCIKGPLTSELGLRPEHHVSQDVDVLVHPRDLETLVAALERAGWTRGVETVSSAIDPPHSVQLENPWFGLEVDVHHRFPGLLREPEAVFDVLWERRVAVAFAHSPCSGTDRVATTLLEMLHLARDPLTRRSRLRRVSEAARSAGREIVDLVSELGAISAVAPYLGSSEKTQWDDVNRDAESKWQLRVAVGRQTSAAALYELSSASWAERPAILWRVAWMSERELMRKYPDLTSGRLAWWRGTTRRWVAGVRSLPEAVRALRQARSSTLRP